MYLNVSQMSTMVQRDSAHTIHFIPCTYATKARKMEIKGNAMYEPV